MRARRRTLLVGLTLVVFAVLTAFAQSPLENFLGTWRLNVEKSKATPGPGPTTVNTRTYEDRGGGVLRVTSRSLEGKVTNHYEVTPADGRYYPFRDGLTIAYTIVDPYTIDFTFKEGGRLLTDRGGRQTFSTDGKTKTIVRKGINAQGQATITTLVYEKQ